MSAPSSRAFQAQSDGIKVDVNTHEWKDSHIRLLEKRLNRERTNIRLARDANKELQVKLDTCFETIKQLRIELTATKQELVELTHSAQEKDSQLQAFRILVEQQENDCRDIKNTYNLQLDSISKSLNENQQRTISQLEEQVKSQKEQLNAKDNTITKLMCLNKALETENTLVSNNLNQFKSSLGISNKKGQPKLKDSYHRKPNTRQTSIDTMFHRQSLGNLESSASKNNEPAQHTTNNENQNLPLCSKEGTRKRQIEDDHVIIPQKRPLHTLPTNQAVNRMTSASSIKKDVTQSNPIDTKSSPKSQPDVLVAVKEEDDDCQIILFDSSSHIIEPIPIKIENPRPIVHTDQSTQNNTSINKKKDTIAANQRNKHQVTSTPSSNQRSEQSSIRLPVSAGHQLHRAHMIGETCMACANFYGNEALVANVHGEQVTVTSNDRIQAHSRHRHTKRATTPPGFWEMDFASPPENDRSRRLFKKGQ